MLRPPTSQSWEARGRGKHPNAPHHPGCPGWHCPVPSLPVPGATHFGRSGAISMDQHRGPVLASCAAQPAQAAVDLLEMVTDPHPTRGVQCTTTDPLPAGSSRKPRYRPSATTHIGCYGNRKGHSIRRQHTIFGTCCLHRNWASTPPGKLSGHIRLSPHYIHL